MPYSVSIPCFNMNGSEWGLKQHYVTLTATGGFEKQKLTMHIRHTKQQF